MRSTRRASRCQSATSTSTSASASAALGSDLCEELLQTRTDADQLEGRVVVAVLVRHLQPMLGLEQIDRDAEALLVHDAGIEGRVAVALLRRCEEQLDGLGLVLLDAVAIDVHQT